MTTISPFLMCEEEERVSIQDDELFERLNQQCGQKNVQIIKNAWRDWTKTPDIDKYMNLIHDDFEGSMQSGIIPGGHSIKGKNAFEKFLRHLTSKARTAKMIEPRDFGHNEKGDVVYYHIDYEVTWHEGPYAGHTWKTTANLREKIQDGKIIEKTVIVNVPATKKGVALDDGIKHDFGNVTPDEEMGRKNIELVKKSIAHNEHTPKLNTTNSRMNNHPILSKSNSTVNNYLDFCHPDYQGELFSGVVPGGANIEGLENLGDWMTSWAHAFDAQSCVVKDFGASEDGNVVYNTAEWDVTWKAGPFKGQHWKTIAVSRKHMKDGKIWKDYNILQFPFDVKAAPTRG